jgi:hypothetical protein
VRPARKYPVDELWSSRRVSHHVSTPTRAVKNKNVSNVIGNSGHFYPTLPVNERQYLQIAQIQIQTVRRAA